MNEVCGQLVHVHPLCKQSAVLQLLAQELQPGLGSRVLLHVFHEAIALGVAGELAVDQETSLHIAIGTHQFLKLLDAEGKGQVGDAQQSIRGLQLHWDLLATQGMLVEFPDGALGLLPVQQGDKRCKRGVGTSPTLKPQRELQIHPKDTQINTSIYSISCLNSGIINWTSSAINSKSDYVVMHTASLLGTQPDFVSGEQMRYSTSRLLFTKLNIPLMSTHHRFCGISLMTTSTSSHSGVRSFFGGFSVPKAFHTIPNQMRVAGTSWGPPVQPVFSHRVTQMGSQDPKGRDSTTSNSAGWPSRDRSVSWCEQTANASGAGQVSLSDTFNRDQRGPENFWSTPESFQLSLVSVECDKKGTEGHQTSCGSPWCHTQHMVFLTELKRMKVLSSHLFFYSCPHNNIWFHNL